jgi:hypothetical protein
MLLVTKHIRQTIAERGFAELEGSQVRSGWPVPTEENTIFLEERLQRWAHQKGWSCEHNSQEDVSILRDDLIRRLRRLARKVLYESVRLAGLSPG